MFDHAQSPRLGQKTAVESPGMTLVLSTDLPEAPYPGQQIYLTDLAVSKVYDGAEWVDVGGTGSSGGGWEATYNFAMGSQTWTIVHNQGTRAVHVQTFDANGNDIEGNVRYPSVNTVEIDWFYDTSGTAVLRK